MMAGSVTLWNACPMKVDSRGGAVLARSAEGHVLRRKQVAATKLHRDARVRWLVARGGYLSRL